jgi:hypothetical protein
MFRQSLLNHRIMVVLTARPSSTEPKYDNGHDRSSGDSHNHKDAGHSPFVLEKALCRHKAQPKLVGNVDVIADGTYGLAFPLLLIKVGLGLRIICVTVIGCPNESVERSVDVKADGADSVVDPWLSVVVIKTVDWYVELEREIVLVDA